LSLFAKKLTYDTYDTILLFYHSKYLFFADTEFAFSLHCVDTVGWAVGRASCHPIKKLMSV